MRKLTGVLLFLLVTLIVAPTVDAHARGARNMSCSGASPQVTVRQYYRAVARHQADVAKS